VSWHGQTPWAAKKAEAILKLRQIRQIAESAERGEMAPAAALAKIEEMAGKQADRIVRIGNTNTPEIETCRDGCAGGANKKISDR
jgi:hypothetical protein